MNEYKDITAAMLPMLEEKLNAAPSIFKLWFSDLSLISMSETKAVFTTPTDLRKKILLSKYIGIIKETLEEVIGFPLEVEILSLDEINKVGEEEEDLDIPVPDPNEDRAGKEERVSELIKAPTDRKSLLDEYTFENFVEGSSNKFARAACMAVAKEPNTYNPLFIYGHSGLGKTHLLYAVINYMKKNHPGLNIVYKKCENFLDELVYAIQNGSTSEFKDKYRTADVLLIDDIQFIAGKVSTQEEFFHTFSALYEHEKQIILTSDRPPKEIKPLEDRLRTRFEGGLLADVQPPSFELRIAIINKKAADMGLAISNSLIEYMAERLQNNIRQIEGVLKKLYAIYSLTSTEVTKEKIDEVISIIDPGNIPTDAIIERILSTVSRDYGISVEDLKSKKKTDNIAKARHVAIYLIKTLTELTLKEIGAIFNRHYSTIISSVELVNNNIKTVNNYERDIKKLIKEIKG